MKEYIFTGPNSELGSRGQYFYDCALRGIPVVITRDDLKSNAMYRFLIGMGDILKVSRFDI